jgi:transcriptional regulator with GAF, ATPase, and Fis domain
VGESGTGKELVAQALHRLSRRTGRFVAVNCGALPSELAESELFGHEKGAFTGAAARKPGLFEAADGGTLFLDEIGELPMHVQPKLLRALELKQVRPVGGSAERSVDVRVVAATHRDLAAAVERGTFRFDLQQRLWGAELCLPPLRERKEDVLPLAGRFLDEIAAETGPRVLSPRALEVLLAHPWPGNVRELKHALHRAAVLAGSPLIEPDHLFPPTVYRLAPTAPLRACEPAPTRRAWTRDPDAERAAMLEALRAHGTSRKAARALGMAKSTFHDRMRRHNLRAVEERAVGEPSEPRS